MITWIKKEHYEDRVMLVFHKTIASLLDEQRDIFALLSSLYVSLGDTPVEDLKSEFITELARIIHKSAEQERAGSE